MEDECGRSRPVIPLGRNRSIRVSLVILLIVSMSPSVSAEEIENESIPSNPLFSINDHTSESGDYDITWSESTYADEYILRENGVVIYEGLGIEYSVVGNTNGTYEYRIQAVNTNGSSEVDTIVITVEIPGLIFGEVWNITYTQNCYRGTAFDSIMSSDGYIYIMCNDYDLWVGKISLEGELIDDYSFENDDIWMKGISIIETSENNIAVVGYSYVRGPRIGSEYSEISVNGLLLVLDDDLNVLSSWSYGGILDDKLLDVVEVDGSYSMVGWSESFVRPVRAVWFLKVDSEGIITLNTTHVFEGQSEGTFLLKAEHGYYVYVEQKTNLNEYGGYSFKSTYLKLDEDGTMIVNVSHDHRVDEIQRTGDGFISIGRTYEETAIWSFSNPLSLDNSLLLVGGETKDFFSSAFRINGDYYIVGTMSPRYISTSIASIYEMAGDGDIIVQSTFSCSDSNSYLKKIFVDNEGGIYVVGSCRDWHMHPWVMKVEKIRDVIPDRPQLSQEIPEYSMTGNLTLRWLPAKRAISYLIYKNGLQVGNTTNLEYSYTGIDEGENVLSVRSWSPNGVSNPTSHSVRIPRVIYKEIGVANTSNIGDWIDESTLLSISNGNIVLLSTFHDQAANGTIIREYNQYGNLINYHIIGGNNTNVSDLSTTEGNRYFVSGTMEDEAGNDQIWAVLMDAQFNEIFSNTYGIGYGKFLINTPSTGGYILIGSTDEDDYIINVDSSGDEITRTSINSHSDYLEYPVRVQDYALSCSGHIWITGNQFNGNDTDILTMEVLPDGTVLSSISYDSGANESAMDIGFSSCSAPIIAGESEINHRSDVILLYDLVSDVWQSHSFGGVGDDKLTRSKLGEHIHLIISSTSYDWTSQQTWIQDMRIGGGAYANTTPEFEAESTYYVNDYMGGKMVYGNELGGNKTLIYYYKNKATFNITIPSNTNIHFNPVSLYDIAITGFWYDENGSLHSNSGLVDDADPASGGEVADNNTGSVVDEDAHPSDNGNEVGDEEEGSSEQGMMSKTTLYSIAVLVIPITAVVIIIKLLNIGSSIERK